MYETLCGLLDKGATPEKIYETALSIVKTRNEEAIKKNKAKEELQKSLDEAYHIFINAKNKRFEVYEAYSKALENYDKALKDYNALKKQFDEEYNPAPKQDYSLKSLLDLFY